jgi:hypothetical protein
LASTKGVDDADQEGLALSVSVRPVNLLVIAETMLILAVALLIIWFLSLLFSLF